MRISHASPKACDQATLEVENKRLRRERDAARVEFEKHKPGPSSVSKFHANLETTCSAMSVVKQWERDAKLDERDARIRDLEATISKQKEENSRLRQGFGSTGEVLLYLEEQGSRMGGPVVSEERRKALLRKDMPVFQCINEVRYASRTLDYIVGRNFNAQLGS